MMKFWLLSLLLVAQLSLAGEKVAYQNWEVELGDKTNEAYTIADANSSLGMFCASEQCLFYLRQGLNCSPGAKYPVLMNSPSISTSLTMECTQIGGKLFQPLTPFEAVMRATQAGENIGFAMALQSGAFAVTRFSLLGAKSAIDRVLVEASKAQHQSPKPLPAPQILIIPPVQILPQAPQIQIPKAPQNPPRKPNSGDIST